MNLRAHKALVFPCTSTEADKLQVKGRAYLGASRESTKIYFSSDTDTRFESLKGRISQAQPLP